jgi:hypothetical protein
MARILPQRDLQQLGDRLVEPLQRGRARVLGDVAPVVAGMQGARLRGHDRRAETRRELETARQPLEVRAPRGAVRREEVAVAGERRNRDAGAVELGPGAVDPAGVGEALVEQRAAELHRLEPHAAERLGQPPHSPAPNS